MVQIILGLALLLLIAFIGHRATFTRLPIGARLLYLTGTEYILVGFALGDELIGLLDEDTLRSLTPLFSLGLGMVGLIIGIQLDRTKISQFPRRYLWATLLQALVTIVVVFVPCTWFLRAVLGADDTTAMLGGLVLASTAGCTAQSALALLGQEYGLRRAPVLELLQYISALDAVVGLALFGFALCLLPEHAPLGVPTARALQWFLLSLALGGAMGVLLHLLTRARCPDEELLIFVIGVALFSSGLALTFRLSPLLINLVLGMVAANLPGAQTRIFNLLTRLEKPFYVLFLVLAGAIWKPASGWALALAGGYLVLRLLGKLSGGYLAAYVAADPRPPGLADPHPPGTLGLGLLSQGGVVLAMVMSYHQLAPSKVTGLVVTAVLAAVIVNELAAPGLVRRVLRRAGEIDE